MGFEINGGFNKPVIKESQQAQDGGAGNLGYFEQERKKKEHEKSIFSETDSFEKKDAEEEISDDFSISKFIAEMILTVKEWFKKTFNL